MKNVLIIDAPLMLREFLTDKLVAEKVHVETAASQRDALTKMFSMLPDLVILNVEKSTDDIYDFLSKKKADLNGKKIPMIITGPVIDKSEVAGLVQYGVIKYFTRPIKFDVFFESIGRVLRMPFTVDDTPCVLDLHLNKDIIFIELAMGLNREKISILKYRISEIIDNNKLAMPKIVVMLTSLSLSFVDGYNLELLFDNLTSDNRILNKNIKILSLDSITKEFIDGHANLHGIEVVENLSDVLNSLVEGNATASVQDVITETLLVADEDSLEQGSVEMRFSSDTSSDEDKIETRIAIIDDDPAVRQILSTTLQSISRDISVYANGLEFVQALETKQFDIAVLDIYMPGLNGFQVLKTLIERKINLPVVVYSQMMQKEYIMQALGLGAKSYLLKPQKPEVILQKVVETLNAKE